SLARLLLSPARPSLRILALLPRRLRGAAGFASTASRRPPACRPPGTDRCLKPLGHLSELSLYYHAACAAPPVLPRLRRGALRPAGLRVKTGALNRSAISPNCRSTATPLARRRRSCLGCVIASTACAVPVVPPRPGRACGPGTCLTPRSSRPAARVAFASHRPAASADRAP